MRTFKVMAFLMAFFLATSFIMSQASDAIDYTMQHAVSKGTEGAFMECIEKMKSSNLDFTSNDSFKAAKNKSYLILAGAFVCVGLVTFLFARVLLRTTKEKSNNSFQG